MGKYTLKITARFLKYVWPLFKIIYESAKQEIANVN